MTALSIIVNIVLILVSIVLIVAVLMQEGQRQGLGAIGGGAETFFGKNLGSSAEGKLKTITKIAAAVFIVLAIVATIITSQSIEDTTNDIVVENEDGSHVHEDGTIHDAEGNTIDAEGNIIEPVATALPEGYHVHDDGTVHADDEHEGEDAEATAEPVVEATAEPTAEPVVEATAEPTAEATAQPAA